MINFLCKAKRKATGRRDSGILRVERHIKYDDTLNEFVVTVERKNVEVSDRDNDRVDDRDDRDKALENNDLKIQVSKVMIEMTELIKLEFLIRILMVLRRISFSSVLFQEVQGRYLNILDTVTILRIFQNT